MSIDHRKKGHLILTRKVDETIVVTVPPSDTATEVRVTPTKLGSRQVRLGFQAPKEVEIFRSEIDRHKQEGREW